jgi:hypothetical protein
MEHRLRHKLWLGSLLVISGLGVALILYYTRYVPGVGGDSVQYVMGAQNLLDGNGYGRVSGAGEIKPITGFPPFFSLVLAGVGLTGIDLFQGARILNAIFFGGSIFLTGRMIFHRTASPWSSLMGSALVLTSLSLVEIHGMVMTEPLFIFLMLLSIYSLIRYLDTHRLILLLLSGATASMATLTRYVGLGLVATGGLSILLLSDRRWRRRLLDCVIFGGITLVPLYLWLRRNAIVGGTTVNRELIFHPMQTQLLRVFLAEVASWLAPRILGLSRPVRNVLVLILAIPWPLIFYVRELRDWFQKRSPSRGEFWRLPWVLAINIASYLGILIINSTLLDAGTTMSAPPRYLAPIFICVVILFVIAIQRILEYYGKRITLQALATLIGGGLILLYSLQIVELVRDPTSIGGYLDYKVKRREAVFLLKTLDEDVPIITNNPEMIYVFVGRPSYMWPIAFDQYKQEERQDFNDQIEATREKLMDGGVLVVFGWPVGTEEMVFDLLETENLEFIIDITFLGYPGVARIGS